MRFVKEEWGILSVRKILINNIPCSQPFLARLSFAKQALKTGDIWAAEIWWSDTPDIRELWELPNCWKREKSIKT